MYHYVREPDERLPCFSALHLEDFRRQLDFFQNTDRIISKSEFEEILRAGNPPDDGFVLTFDDGLIDHYQYVLPELVKRNIWGIFYITTGIVELSGMLDVHKVHLLLGQFGGVEVLAALHQCVTQEMLVPEHIETFFSTAYAKQDSNEATLEVKRTLNFYIKDRFRTLAADKLLELLEVDLRLYENYYCTLDMLREMHECGMTIGSHGVSHQPFSVLSDAQQLQEINESFSFLESKIGNLGLKTFCYPYGFKESYTCQTIWALDKESCQFSFTVEPRDISSNDLVNNPQELPRYDCNMFPHGQIRPSLSNSS